MNKKEAVITSSWLKGEEVSKIFSALDNQARFVGGCVRNSLLNLPITDIDIATPIPPEEVLEKLQNTGIKAIPTGIKHGTITAIINNNGYEITTLRKDIECDGRHAKVEFTDKWQEDAARRDFTINAMSCDIEGKIYDYFNGLQDIDPVKVRFVGNANERCQEDYLRILRFFRFSALYSNSLDKDGLNAAKKWSNELPNLAAERIWQEIRKLLSARNPIWALQAMCDSSIWYNITGTNSNLEILNNYLEVENKFSIEINHIARLAAIVMGNNESKYKIFKASNKELNLLKILTSNIPYQEERQIKEIIRKHGNQSAELYIALHSNCDKDLLTKNIDIAKNWQVPDFPISGKDLLALGCSKGKEIGILLDKANDYWVNSNYLANKEDLIRYIVKKQ